jgi:stalled ribosome rescue protein Dom34
MSEYFDAVIFIDRREAKVFHLSATDEAKLKFERTATANPLLEADQGVARHVVDDEFMRCIVESLDHTGQTLIVGPGNSKFELQKYMQQHTPGLAARISRVETLDDPKDAGILETARQFFRTRNHRHTIQPSPSSRHYDTPSKS